MDSPNIYHNRPNQKWRIKWTEPTGFTLSALQFDKKEIEATNNTKRNLIKLKSELIQENRKIMKKKMVNPESGRGTFYILSNIYIWLGESANIEENQNYCMGGLNR